MTKLDWSRVKQPLPAIEQRKADDPASQRQMNYLNVLATRLGYPNGRRMVADFTNQDASLIRCTRPIASSCINEARARLTRHAGLTKQAKRAVVGRT